jgi:hypothetical protein
MTMAVNQQQMTSSRYIGALLAVGVGIPIPILGAFATLLGYFALSALSAPTTIITFLPLLGLIFSIIVWLLLAFFFMPLATASGGKLSDYEIIQGDLRVLKAQLAAVKSQAAHDNTQSTPPKEPDKIAMAEIQSNLEDIDNMLNCNGLAWVMRTGYVNSWSRINKADEAMIDILPPEQVIEGAKYDMLSLTDSKVPNNKDLIKNLDTAISTLSSDPNRSKQSWAQFALLKHAVEPPGSSTATNNKEQEARSTIRQVRAALHRFTNERWDALVRARNQLMGTALLASVLTYILVDLAILVGVVPKSTLEQISVFYLLGAIVGLFSRMLNESNAKDADIAHMDDYGLTAARILVTPLLSGLAALVGVLLAAMLSIVLTTAPGQGTKNLTTFVENIYNFNMYPQNLAFAAVFGYLPSLVIGLLKQQTNKIQSEIHSSSPAD